MPSRPRSRRARPLVPGLHGIENLTDTKKTARITTIANDVISAITQIAEMKSSGVLRDRHTRPIEDMIDTFGNTDSSYRRELERLLRKRGRSLKALVRRHREELDGLVRSAAVGFSRLRRKNEVLEEQLQRARQDFVAMEMRYLGAVAKKEKAERVSRGQI